MLNFAMFKSIILFRYGLDMKTKPFRELLEKRLTKEEIAEIEKSAQDEISCLKERKEINGEEKTTKIV